MVRIRKHNALHDLFLSGSLTPYGGNGVTHRFHNPVLSETGSDAKFQTLESSLSLPVGPVTDRVEMRLSHQNLGEVERISRYASDLLPRAQVNPLFEALKCFCGESEFKELLVHPWSTPTKAKPEKKRTPQESTAFEEHVTWLLSVLGFSAIRLGAHERLRAPGTEFQLGSVDILAAKPHHDVLLVIGCTMGAPSPQDFTNILSACDALRREAISPRRPRPASRVRWRCSQTSYPPNRWWWLLLFVTFGALFAMIALIMELRRSRG